MRRPTLALAPAFAAAFALGSFAGLAACGSDEPDEPRIVRPGPPPGTAAAASEEASRTGAGDLAYELPQGWVAEPPSSSFRLAQARIPGAGGDAELAIFFFGAGQGGGVEANVERWLGQVEGGGEPTRETFEVGELTVHTVEAEGTLTPSPMSMRPGAAPEPQPGAMLLGAVVEGPGGPWFFKATGPAETLQAERQPFFEMLRSLRLSG